MWLRLRRCAAYHAWVRAFTAGLLLLVLAGGLLSGCGQAADEDVLVVRQGDAVLASFTLQRLEELPDVAIATPQSHGAQVQHGPTVRSVLDAAGATDIRSVRVVGRDPAQTLTAAELTDRVIVSVTATNNVNQISPRCPGRLIGVRISA